MASPDVSVVMSVYNAAETVMESIHSVLSQEGVSLELIVINDGSTDGTAAILDEASRRDSRMKVVHKHNEGLTRALIDGCAAARGAYLARIDAGDVMMPDRLVRQKAVLDAHPDVVLVTCWTEFCGPEWESLYVSKGSQGKESSRDIWIKQASVTVDEGYLVNGPTSHPSVMFRMDTYRAAGGYRWQFYYGQDGDLWCRLADYGKFAGVSAVLYRCRVFPEGISMRNNESQRRIHQCLWGTVRARRSGASEEPFLRDAAAIRPAPRASGSQPSSRPQSNGWYFVGEALRRNGDSRAIRYFREACLRHPWDLKNWLRLAQSAWVASRSGSVA